MNDLVLLEEAQKLVRMGSFLWTKDADDVRGSESLREVLGLDPSESISLRSIAERFRYEDRQRLMTVLRNEGGAGSKGVVLAIAGGKGTGRYVQVKSRPIDFGSTMLSTMLEVESPAGRRHELSNLLMVVQGNLDLIRMNVTKPDKIPIHVDLANHAVERLTALLQPARAR